MYAGRSTFVLFVKSRANKFIFIRCCSNSVIDKRRLKSFDEIPGPLTLPYLGSIFALLPYIGTISPKNDNIQNMTNIHTKYGNLVRFIPGFGKNPILFTFNPDDIEMVYRSENLMPYRPGFESLVHFRKDVKKSEGSTGLITEHQELWKSFRSTVNPVLLQPKTIRLYNTPLDEVAKDMVQRLKDLRDAKNRIRADFELEMNKWSLESIGLVGLGGRIGCLKHNISADSEAYKLIEVVREIFQMMYELDFKPSFWRLYPTIKYKKGMAIYQKQIDLSRFFIEKARTQLRDKPRKENEEKGVLEKLLEIDTNVAVTMASDMLFAGVDTAAHTMIGILYLLASNQDKQDKLRQELLSSKDKRPYLKACIKEAQRILPVAGGNARRTSKEYVMEDYIIPKGVDVVLPHQYLSSMNKHFVRAKEFIPERYLVEKSDPLYYGHAHQMVNLPFGFGARSCIGRRIAELEIEVFLARVIESFKIKWFGPPPKCKSISLNYIVGPYNFIFEDYK